VNEVRVEIRIEDGDPEEEVEVVAINVEAGAKVSAGEALMEVASDKANMDLIAPIDGVLAELFVAEFDVVKANHVFAVISDE
jgi:pyruvate/2-oxoglutarate dehydrogenase complex dihydrolipoamide acyltransferase (E2) component